MSLKPAFITFLSTHSSLPESHYTTSKWHAAAITNALDRLANTPEPEPEPKSSSPDPSTTKHPTPGPSSSSSTSESSPAPSTMRKQKLIRPLLNEIVRPAFSGSRSKAVTAEGRRAQEAWQPVVPHDSEAIERGKGWRAGDAWVVDVFEWCLNALDESVVDQNWAMLVPPILAHIDDDTNVCRVRGCAMLRRLLEVTSTKFLTRTGMGEVFEQALLPYLMHIPPAFEEAQSIELLSAVYPTLLRLVQVRFPKRQGEPRTDKVIEGRQKSLDRILRKGVFTGLTQLTDDVEVSRVLLQQLGPLLTELGIYSVKHLKVMVPLVSKRLTNPFATAAPELMRDAAKALLAIELNAWPRVPYWCLDIMEAISMAFVRIEIDKSSSEDVRVALSGVQSELANEVEALKAILKQNDVDGGFAKCTQILESDEDLEPLLEIWTM